MQLLADRWQGHVHRGDVETDHEEAHRADEQDCDSALVAELGGGSHRWLLSAQYFQNDNNYDSISI